MKKTILRRLLYPLSLALGFAALPALHAETLDSVSHYGNARLVADGGQAATVSAGGIAHGADFSGSASGNYALTTGGADFWGNSDQGSFIYDNASGARTGNFSAIVRMRVGLTGEVLAGNWGRSGPMARKNPTAGNSANFAHYRIFAGNNGNENTRFGTRDGDGAGTGDRGNHGNSGQVNDENQWIWLGLHRNGNRVGTSWAPDNAGSPGEWSNFISRVGTPDQLGPVWVGLAHQNHGSSGVYGPEAPARQISTGLFEQFQVTDFNGALGQTVLPPPGVLPGPMGTCDNFGVYEVRGPGGNIAQAVDTLLNGTETPVTGQLPKLDVSDPETNASGGPVLTDPPIPYLTNTPGPDDDIKTSAKGRLKVVKPGDYTFNFHGDDGFAARIVGQEWTGVEGAGSIDFADTSVVFFPNGTGDHNTRAVVNLAAGEYDFEYVNWEGGGGAYYEVTVACGNRLGSATQWLALGDPSVLPELPPTDVVSLTAPADSYKVGSTTPASPNGDDFSAPSRFGQVGDGLIRDNILNNIGGSATTRTQSDLFIPSGETPAGPGDNYHMGVFGTIRIDNGNATPGESIDLTFRCNSDDGSQFRIIGQDFTGFAGDAHTYLETIDGDDSLTGDFFTGNANAIGHITLVEGTYDFEAFMYEGGGGDKLEVQYQPGTVTGGTWLNITAPIPENVGIQLVDGTKSSIGVSFTSNRDTAAILGATETAGVPVDQTTGSPFTNWNSSTGTSLSGAGANDGGDGTTADIAGPIAGTLVADIGGVATPTGVTITWDAVNTWNTNNGTTNGDNKLMNGYIDNNGGTPVTPISLAGINSYYQDGYSVYVYVGSDGNTRTGTVENVGGQTYSFSTFSQQAGGFPGTYAQSTDTGGGNPPANYIVFSGLSGDTQDFNIIRGSNNGGAHGIQIVGVPKPATLAMFDGPSDADRQLANCTTTEGSYWQDFDFADGTTDLGDGTVIAGSASVQGGALQLTEDLGASGTSSFSIPALPNSSLGWTATFDLTIIDSVAANPPADGMSLNYGNAALGTLGSSEEGMAGVAAVTENVSFEIDTWMNGDGEQGVNIAQKAGGADSNLAFTNGVILEDGTTVGGPVTMRWHPTEGASFTTEGLVTNAAFSNVPTTFSPSDLHSFIFSGRVGGANETKLIDNLHIVTDLSAPVDYGLTPQNSTVTRVLALKNTGSRALVIPAGGISVGTGFTVLNGGGGIVIGAGETYGLMVRFDATGDYTSELTINADCNCDIPFVVKLVGGVPPVIHCPEDIVVNAPAGGMSDPVTYLTSAWDESGTATLVCTPMSGSVFPIGVTEVVCVATDEAGNESTASFNVIVLEIQPAASERTLTAVSLRGDSAEISGKGAGAGAGDVPSGATIFFFNHAFINNDGTSIVEAALLSAGASNVALYEADDSGLQSVLAVKGGLSPFESDYSSFDHLAIADDGTSSFAARITGGSGHITDDGTNGAISTTADAPGAPGAVPRVLHQPASSGDDNLFSPVNLTFGTGGVTVGDDTGIWSSAAGGSVVREGGAAPGLPGVSYGQIAGRVVSNSEGLVAYSTNLAGAGAANSAAWAGAPGSATVVAQKGDTAPGTGGAVFNSFGGEAIGESGAVAIRAFLRTQAGLVDASNNTGLWTNRNGGLELIAQEGDDAPCLPATGVWFARFTDIYVAEDNTVCFFAFLGGASVNSGNDGSFWRSSPDGTLHLVVREGDEANNTDGAAISRIHTISCNNTGGVIYVAVLASGIGDVVTKNNLGLWIDEGEELAAELVLRKSDTFSLEKTERTVTEIGFDYTTNPVGGTGGYGRIINDSGDAMLKLSFSGNQSGIFVLGTNDE